MRRVQNDTTSTSQAVRNLATNPEMVAGVSDKVIRTNLFTNPSFETAGAQFNARTNLPTNPSFETANGTIDIKTNLATNPSFENVSTGTDILRKNIASAGQFVITYNVTGASNTSGVSWQGKNWTRHTQGTNTTGICRLNVPLTELVDGATYTVSWLVGNDGPTSVGVATDWCDVSNTSFIIAPGEQRRVYVTATRATYNSVYRFSDLYLPVASTSILFSDVLIEQTDQQRPFFNGDTPDTLGWDYGWTGTAGSSVSSAKALMTEIARNVIRNPRMGTDDVSTVEVRKNHVIDPRAVNPFPGYGSQTVTAVTISDHPLGITTANRVVSGGQSNPGIQFLSSVQANTTYTMSAWVYHETSSPSYLGHGFAQSSVTSSVLPNIVPGQWVRYSWTYTTGVATNNFGYRIGSAPPAGESSFLITGIMVETNSTLSAYFDGATAATTDYTFHWLGAINASTSIQKGTRVLDYARSGSDTSMPHRFTDPVVGRVLRYFYGTSNNAIALNLDSLSLNTAIMQPMDGKTYTLTFKARAGFAATVKTRISGTQGPSVTLVPGQWQTISSTSVFSSTGGYTGIYMNPITEPNTGQYLDIADVMMVEGTYTGPFFHGSSASFSDFSHKWTGTPDNSESVFGGPRVAVSSTGRANAISSYDWAGSGKNSLRVVSNSSTNPDVYIEPVSISTFAPSTQYTVTATVRRSAPLTGPLVANSNGGLFWHFNGGEVAGKVNSANVAGTETLTATFTTPSSMAGYSTFRLYNGTMRGNGDIWYDNFTISEGPTSAPYFDGDTPAFGDYTYAWTGTPHASTSAQRAVAISGVTSVPSLCRAFQSTTGATLGSKSLRIIGTHPTSKDSFADFMGMLATTSFESNTTYTLSADRTITAPLVGWDGKYSRVWIGSELSITTVSAPANVAGTGRVVLRFTTGTDVSKNFIRLYAGTAAGGGDVWYDKLVLEKGVTDGSYFDGSTPVYQNLCTNPSFETNTSAWTSVSATLTRSTSEGGDGHVGELTQTTVGGVRNTAVWISAEVLPAGPYTVAFDVKATDASLTTVRSLLYDSVSAGVRDVDTLTLIKDGKYNRYVFNFDATGSFDRVYMEVQGTAIPIGTKAWIDQAIVVRGTTDGSYYTGSGDYTYAWAGTANASQSYQKATGIAGLTHPYYGNFIQSSEWATTPGKKSLRISPNMGTNETFTGILGGWSTLGPLVAGKTYTISATLRLAAPLTGTLHPFALTLAWRDTAGRTNSVKGNNVAGTQRLVLTHTIPADRTFGFFELFNGSLGGSGDVWWDDIVVTEGTYAGPYFDGSSSSVGEFTYAWSGATNSSTSTQRAMNVSGSSNQQRAEVYASTSAPFSGSSSAKGFVTAIGYFPRYEQWFTPVPGRRYTAMAKMKASSGPVQIAIKWQTNPDIHAPVTQQAASNGNWTTAKASAIAPDNATLMYVWMGVPDNAPLGTEFEIDQLMVVGKDYNGPFGTGGTYGWTWEGTPNASTSIGFPVGILQLAGKPLYVATTMGTYVLTDVDPAKNPVLAENAPRTIYTVVNNLKDIDTGYLSTVFIYGVDDLSDATHPNQTIMMRQQSQAGASVGAVLARRTGGGGPIALNVPSIGKQILINGLNENGYLFSGVNREPIVTDTGIQIVVPHERLKIEPNTSHHQHIATYIYPGVHSPAVRQEMVKLLAHEYAIPGM